VPVVPGSGVLADADAARAAAADMGYPVLLKASAGGGGRGIRRIDDDSALTESFLQAQREVTAAFGDGSMYLERSLENVRHVEVQVLSDGRGRTIHLFERECSMQRRRQKVIEETPAPGLPTDVRQRMCSAAVDLAASVGYASAGTVEFLVEPNGEFSFIEMNTRIQVEHGITEMLTGIDLVQWQLRVAFGEDLGLEQSDVQPRGAVIEVRLNAEDPRNSFMGSPGTLTLCRFPAGPGVRVDSGFEQGAEVQPFYDSMIAKVMAHAPSRPEAIRRARRALDETKIEGVTTTIDFTRTLLESEAFISGNYTTATLENLLEA
jgi:acetyl-CoA carboxylase biotin carboxylase subunit